MMDLIRGPLAAIQRCGADVLMSSLQAHSIALTPSQTFTGVSAHASQGDTLLATAFQ